MIAVTQLVFSIGLQQSSGPILIQATKQEYIPGDSVLVLGSTNANALLSLEMSDPDGEVLKKKDIFSDKEGKFSEGTFRVPSDAKQGQWVDLANESYLKSKTSELVFHNACIVRVCKPEVISP